MHISVASNICRVDGQSASTCGTNLKYLSSEFMTVMVQGAGFEPAVAGFLRARGDEGKTPLLRRLNLEWYCPYESCALTRLRNP